MTYRRRRSTPLSRWIVGTIFLAVAVLAASTVVGWLESRSGGGTGGEAASADSAASRRAAIRVEVLNGAGDPGAAERVARWVRDLGFDVVYFGNASHFDHGVSHVVDRNGETGGARVLARALAVDSLASDLAPELFLDATLVLGQDWRDRFSGATGRFPNLGSGAPADGEAGGGG